MVSEMLDFIFGAVALLPMPLETPYAHMRRIRHYGPGDVPKIIWNLKNSGAVQIFEKNNQKFIKLTKKGELKLLFEKSKLNKPKEWDGKWRLLMFDIPEGSRKKRNQIRRLLKQAGFSILQKSVFISPYPLNREAVNFLKESGLIEFIRMMRVDDIDDDKKLKKKFGLK